MILTDRFDAAFEYASQLHRSQRRKGTEIPYMSHLMAVCSLTLEHGGDEDQAIAALLHDAAEDQGGEETLRVIRNRFGDGVAEIVADCTDAWTNPKPEWRIRKELYIQKLPYKPARSLLVSLADKTHNARAILLDYQAIGEPLWSRFNAGKNGVLWYYRSIADVLRSALPCALANELESTVDTLSRIATRG